MADALPFGPADGGLRLAVRVTPRAKRSEAAGIVRDAEGRAALSVRLAAPPVEGAANKALVAFLAKELGLAKGAIRILSGEAARHKMLFIDSDDPGISAILSRWAVRETD